MNVIILVLNAAKNWLRSKNAFFTIPVYGLRCCQNDCRCNYTENELGKWEQKREGDWYNSRDIFSSDFSIGSKFAEVSALAAWKYLCMYVLLSEKPINLWYFCAQFYETIYCVSNSTTNSSWISKSIYVHILIGWELCIQHSQNSYQKTIRFASFISMKSSGNKYIAVMHSRKIIRFFFKSLLTKLNIAI